MGGVSWLIGSPRVFPQIFGFARGFDELYLLCYCLHASVRQGRRREKRLAQPVRAGNSAQ
jgi:hypothetical protein